MKGLPAYATFFFSQKKSTSKRVCLFAQDEKNCNNLFAHPFETQDVVSNLSAFGNGHDIDTCAPWAAKPNALF